MGRRLPAIVFLLLLSGCVTVGRDFDPEVFHKLTPGTTTTADVLTLVGEPYVRQILPDGTEQWIYLSTSTGLTPGQTKTMTLQSRDGVLVKPSAAPVIIGREFDPAVPTRRP